MTKYPWRFRCPEDHASLDIGFESYWCDTCHESYDMKTLEDRGPDFESARS